MSEQFEKASETNANNLSTSDYCSTIIKPSQNSDILFSKEKVEDRNIYQHDAADYLQLPDFCRQLPKQMKNAAISIKKLTNIPYEISVPYLLGVINCAVQSRYNVNTYLYTPRPTTLYMLLMLPTGMRKTTLESMCMKTVHEYQEKMEQLLQPLHNQYETDSEIYKKQRAYYIDQTAKGNTVPAPHEPKRPETADYIQNQFTILGIRDLLKWQPYANIITSEAGEIFNGWTFHDSNGKRGMEWIIALSKFWSEETITSLIQGAKIKTKGRRINLIALAQPNILEDVINNRAFANQGFLHRILMVQSSLQLSPPAEESQDYLDWRNAMMQKMEPFHLRMRQLFAMPHKLDPAYPDDYRLLVQLLNSSPEAKTYMIKLSNDASTWALSGARLEDYAGFAERIHEHTYRIAANLAVFRGNEQIELEDVECARSLMDMFIHARLNMEFDLENKDIALTKGATALLKYFQDRSTEEFTKRELRANCSIVRPTKVTATQFEELLAELVANYQIVCKREPNKNGRLFDRFKLATEADIAILEGRTVEVL
jgi:hypothetical protein